MGDWGFSAMDVGLDAGGGGSAASAGGSSLFGSGGGADAWTSGLVNFFSAQSANRMARDNQKWAYDMEMAASNTAVQRRVQDLQAAGLNPMLAMGQTGSASTPNVTPNLQPKVPMEQALIGAATASQVQKTTAEAKQIESQTMLNQVMAPKVAAETVLATMSATQISELTKKIPVEIRSLEQGILESRQRVVTSKSEAEKMEAQKHLAEQEERLRFMETIHRALDMPRAMKESSMHETWFGTALPYLRGLSGVAGGLSSAAGAFAGARFGR